MGVIGDDEARLGIAQRMQLRQRLLEIIQEPDGVGHDDVVERSLERSNEGGVLDIAGDELERGVAGARHVDHALGKIDADAARGLEPSQQVAGRASELEHPRALADDEAHEIAVVVEVGGVGGDPRVARVRPGVGEGADRALALRQPRAVVGLHCPQESPLWIAKGREARVIVEQPDHSADEPDHQQRQAEQKRQRQRLLAAHEPEPGQDGDASALPDAPAADRNGNGGCKQDGRQRFQCPLEADGEAEARREPLEGNDSDEVADEGVADDLGGEGRLGHHEPDAFRQRMQPAAVVPAGERRRERRQQTSRNRDRDDKKSADRQHHSRAVTARRSPKCRRPDERQ